MDQKQAILIRVTYNTCAYQRPAKWLKYKDSVVKKISLDPIPWCRVSRASARWKRPTTWCQWSRNAQHLPILSSGPRPLRSFLAAGQANVILLAFGAQSLPADTTAEPPSGLMSTTVQYKDPIFARNSP